MEFHIYGPHHPEYRYRTCPTSFDKTGLAAASWPTTNLEETSRRLKAAGVQILGEAGLPLRNNSEPVALVIRGPLGEIIELIQQNNY